MKTLITALLTLSLSATVQLDAQPYKIVVNARAHDGTNLQSSHAWEKIGRLFEMQALPRVILVDSKGFIVAVDEQASGSSLETMLMSLCGGE